jgi:predicted nucleic acid-binding Zn ribbon protein
MPVYRYRCPENGAEVEVRHSVEEKLRMWGELCKLAEREPGETPESAAVERLILAPLINTPRSDSRLKEMGFTKLVKRDAGVYENVTRSGDEKRYMEAGDASSLPHLRKKISD